MTSHCTTHTCAHTPLSAEGQCLCLYSRDLQVLLDLVYMYCMCVHADPDMSTSVHFSPLSLSRSLFYPHYFCKSVDLCLTSRSYFVLSLMPFMDPFLIWIFVVSIMLLLSLSLSSICILSRASAGVCSVSAAWFNYKKINFCTISKAKDVYRIYQ